MIVSSRFKPLWWLKNPHLQTLWPIIANQCRITGRTERLELADGDFLDLNWFEGDGPLVIVVHGLEGSIKSPYASHVMKSLSNNGFQGLFMHLRGCSGEPNRLDRAYHSGETGDIATVVDYASQITGKPVFAVIGYSLGGNALLKWMGEQGEQAPVQTAVAVSIPFQLADAARRLTTGPSRIYQQYLLSSLRRNYQKKYAERPSPLSIDVKTLKTFFDFDDQITAALHGFEGVDDYYRRSSSRQYLKNIQRDTLIIHSLDDPFMFTDTVPDESELSEYVALELASNGGHVGFISGRILPKRWLEPRIIDYLKHSRDKACFVSTKNA